MERRLAAIVAADVVGYSRMIRADETGTLTAFRSAMAETVNPVIAKHRGRIVKLMGDGLLVEFSSAVDAVMTAVEVQQAMSVRNNETHEDHSITFRVGVNLGDVVIDGDDIQGDGVNLAARLEAVADPGAVCVSDAVHDQVRDRLDLVFANLGERQMKNIDRPVQVWQWADTALAAKPALEDAKLQASEKPSIAMLTFDNMSGDPEQAYFSDGLTEDITTALSKHRWLDVIARNTAFASRNHSTDIRNLAAEMGAHYVVEGSVRRSGQRIRVTAQLIDAGTGNHVWAERYDRDLEDIFDVQDEITGTIVGRLEPAIGADIRQKVQRAPRRDLHAWDSYHLGIANLYKFTAEGNLEAQRLLQRSRELDPEFSEAHAFWAYATILGMVYWDTEPDPALMDEALAAARTALALDNENALIHSVIGRVQLARCEYRSALAESETAIRLNPTLAMAYCCVGDSLTYEGRYEEATPHYLKAVEMSPSHPQLWAFLSYGALNFIFSHDFQSALEWAERASDIPNCQYWTTAHAAVALVNLERFDEARKMVKRLLIEQPAFTRTFAKKRLFYLKRPEQLTLYLSGLAMAGVPAT